MGGPTIEKYRVGSCDAIIDPNSSVTFEQVKVYRVGPYTVSDMDCSGTFTKSDKVHDPHSVHSVDLKLAKINLERIGINLDTHKFTPQQVIGVVRYMTDRKIVKVTDASSSTRSPKKNEVRLAGLITAASIKPDSSEDQSSGGLELSYLRRLYSAGPVSLGLGGGVSVFFGSLTYESADPNFGHMSTVETMIGLAPSLELGSETFAAELQLQGGMHIIHVSEREQSGAFAPSLFGAASLRFKAKEIFGPVGVELGADGRVSSQVLRNDLKFDIVPRLGLNVNF